MPGGESVILTLMLKILRGIDPLNMNVTVTADLKFEVMFQVCLILYVFNGINNFRV